MEPLKVGDVVFSTSCYIECEGGLPKYAVHAHFVVSVDGGTTHVFPGMSCTGVPITNTVGELIFYHFRTYAEALAEATTHREAYMKTISRGGP